MAGDRSRALLTPEGVDLRVRLGEAGSRAGAFLLDLTIMVVFLIVFTIGLGRVLLGTEAGSEIFAVIWLLVFFVLRLFYFTLFELGPRAATPGKRAVGLRVASRDGRPLRPESIVARNAMREVEVFLPLSFIFSNAGDAVSGRKGRPSRLATRRPTARLPGVAARGPSSNKVK